MISTRYLVADFVKIDFITAMYGVHRLSGIVTPANAAYSAAELSHQLKSSGAKALISCVPLMTTALKAAQAAGIPVENVFIFDLPGFAVSATLAQQTVETLIAEGAGLPDLDAMVWVDGQGARQPAFLCYSSGTSGLPVSAVRLCKWLS